MTARENEILNMIKENPLISQNDLAERLNITRASAASHIHNLTKKGYISGRGYILREPAFVCVIGGINMDIFGIPKEELIEHNSNPGKITFSLGGAGRNIAMNLTKLEVTSYLISVFGADVNGEKFISDAMENGMDIQHCKKLEGERTSTYLYIDEPNGQLKVGIDDMDIYKKITPEFLNKKIDLINSSQYCVIDTNLPKESIEWLFDNCKVPIIVKTVSLNKNYKLINGLNKINTLILTPSELKQITDKFNSEETSVEKRMNILLDKGVQHVIVFSSVKRHLLFKSKENTTEMDTEFNSSANTNGASAALTAAVVWGLMNEMNWQETLKFAYATAIHCMESHNSVNYDLSVPLIRRRMGV
ncbi:sugar kinase [Bacillus sp. FJAT-18017]|nr:sugar kinase [Bacillus sp. FJAT-18017]